VSAEAVKKALLGAIEGWPDTPDRPWFTHPWRGRIDAVLQALSDYPGENTRTLIEAFATRGLWPEEWVEFVTSDARDQRNLALGRESPLRFTKSDLGPYHREPCFAGWCSWCDGWPYPPDPVHLAILACRGVEALRTLPVLARESLKVDRVILRPWTPARKENLGLAADPAERHLREAGWLSRRVVDRTIGPPVRTLTNSPFRTYRRVIILFPNPRDPNPVSTP